jgi:hypothetical protein
MRWCAHRGAQQPHRIVVWSRISHRIGRRECERLDLIAAHQPRERSRRGGSGIPDASPIRIAIAGGQQVGPRRHALVGARKALQPADGELQRQAGVLPRLLRLLGIDRDHRLDAGERDKAQQQPDDKREQRDGDQQRKAAAGAATPRQNARRCGAAAVRA